MTHHRTGVEIRAIDATDTHDLRRRVLRTGTPSTDVNFADDDHERVLHLGAFLDRKLVAVGTFLPRSTPWRPERHAVQLRGMAVEPVLQGTGIGRLLLEGAVERLRADGVEVLWANARDTALAFYERVGMGVVGAGFGRSTPTSPTTSWCATSEVAPRFRASGAVAHTEGMTAAASDPSGLRRRAQSLRATAAALDRGGVRAALAAAGPETWTGPAATALVTDLARSAATLERASAELRRLAQRLEHEAGQLP